MEIKEKICRLCLEAKADYGEVIEETIKEMLEVLLINIDLNITDNAVACIKCWEELQDCFQFKSACFYVDDYIAPFVENGMSIDMKKLLQEDLGSKANEILENVRLCRLCMSLIEDSKALNYNTDLKLDWKMVIGNCLPEVDLNTVDKPLICEACLHNIKRLNEFMNTCREVEQRVQNYYQVAPVHGNSDKEELHFDEIITKCSEDEDSSIIKCEKGIICEELDNVDGISDKVTIHDLINLENSDAVSEPLKEELHFDEIITKCSEDEDRSIIKCEEGIIREELDIVQICSNNENISKYHYRNYKSEQNGDLNEHISVIHEKSGNHHLHGEGVFYYKCPSCDKIFRAKINLEEHLLKNHKNVQRLISNIIHVCKFCTYETKKSSNFKRHVSTHEGPGMRRKLRGEKVPQYNCPSCEKRFSRKNDFDNHLLRNHENVQHLISNTIHDCKFCTFKTTISTDFKRHVSSKHKGNERDKLYCYNCNYFCYDKSALRRHVRVHLNFRPYQCPSCKKGFIEKRYFEIHILRHQKEDADFIKTVSNEIQKFNLNTHIPATHESPALHGKDGYQYMCPSCGKRFTAKRNLEDHLLKNHENVQHLIGNRIHECKLCTYKTVFAATLKYHIASQHKKADADKLHCYNCNYFCYDKGNLRQHVLRHSNYRPHQCSSCKKGFTQKTFLDLHIVRNHKEDTDLLKTI